MGGGKGDAFQRLCYQKELTDFIDIIKIPMLVIRKFEGFGILHYNEDECEIEWARPKFSTPHYQDE